MYLPIGLNYCYDGTKEKMWFSYIYDSELTPRLVTQAIVAISLTVISETHSSSSGDSVGSTSPEPGALVPVTGIVKVVN